MNKVFKIIRYFIRFFIYETGYFAMFWERLIGVFLDSKDCCVDEVCFMGRESGGEKGSLAY